MTHDSLRRLPQVNAWLDSDQGAALCAEYSRAEVTEVMRSHLQRIRGELEQGRGELPELVSEAYTNLLRADLLERRTLSLKSVINATGIVIHTNLGRAPLAEEAIEAIREAASGYSNLEYDLDTGRRGSRQEHLTGLLCELTGAEAALVVNNCAAAVVLVLKALADGGEVVVSRGELIEIGGSFRMPDVIAQSGARMIEVGTTNRTRLKDYADAVTDQTRVLLTSHPSNYRIVGFTESPKPQELAGLARDRALTLVQDLGSGSLCRLTQLDAAEPTVAECVAGGAEVVTFSGDKLLGGPQAGIIVGRRKLIDAIRQHPLARAMRLDKLSLAALAATLRLYKPPHDPFERVPVLRMISEGKASIARRSLRVARQLKGLERVQLKVEDGVSYAGGGSLPMSEIETKVIRVTSAERSANELAAHLRTMDPPIVGRVHKDALILDLRTVLPSQMRRLVGTLKSALS